MGVDQPRLYRQLVIRLNGKDATVTTCAEFMVGSVGQDITAGLCLLSHCRCIYFNYGKRRGKAVSTQKNIAPDKNPLSCEVGIAYESGKKAQQKT